MKVQLSPAALCAVAVVVLLDSAHAQAQGPIVLVPGAGPSSYAGFSVGVVGDLNADGKAEYIVGEPRDWFFGPMNTSYWQGNFIVFDGDTGNTLYTDYGSFTFPGDKLGTSVSGLGDLNGDGIPEFCAGAVQGNIQYPTVPPQFLFSGHGYVKVYDGATGGLIRRISGVTAPPPGNGVAFGVSVANIGDVDGDGIGDLAVGSPYDMWSGVQSEGPGQVWVYSGASIVNSAPGNILPIYRIVSPFYGTPYNEAFGTSIDGLTDLDGDGANEIVIGAPNSNSGEGAAYVYSGATGTLLFANLGTSGGFEHHGTSVARAGDVDQDGFEDFLVGAPEAGAFVGGANEGRVRVISGTTGAALFTFFGDAIYSGIGVNCGSRFGYSVAGVGDLDGDAFPDFALAAPGDNFLDPDATAQALSPGQTWFAPPTAWAPPYTGNAVGTVRIMSGRSGGLLKTYSGAYLNAGMGCALAGGADINGDGTNDIVIGACAGLTTGPGYHAVFSGKYELGQVWGYANPNTTGSFAALRASGSQSISENNLTFTVTGLPGGTSGLFYYGPNMLAAPISVSTGLHWLGNPVYRMGAVFVPPAGPSGTATLVKTINLNLAPFAGVVTPGTEFGFQFYYRNSAAGPGATNLSEPLNIGFMP